MISSSNCYSSGTAEWAKHVWSFALPKTISTPHTFPPSVCCLDVKLSFCSLCLASNQCLLNVDISSFLYLMPSSAQTGFLAPLHAQTGLPYLLYLTLRLLLLVFFSFSSHWFCLFPNPSPPTLSLTSHSSLCPQKVHPPSFLSLLPSLCFPRRVAGPVACTVLFSFQQGPSRLPPLLSICLRACPPKWKMW